VRRTQLLVVGVDGLDHDVVRSLGPDVLPTLAPLVASSAPHASTFPPDSVPSWTSILTGEPPWRHGQLHSVNFLLDEQPAQADLAGWRGKLAWDTGRQDVRTAVLNPFLAHPPFPPDGAGAMVSGPSFSEGTGTAVDPLGLLPSANPPRMGGFSWMPSRSELEGFAADTGRTADEQYGYFLRVLTAAAFDIVFCTTLVLDRMEHVFWRFHDPADPLHPGPTAFSDVIVDEHRRLDAFLAEARSLCADDHTVVVVSDHGHGPRAYWGINLQEILRREGLFHVSSGLRARLTEFAKTMVLSSALNCHADPLVLAAAKRAPKRSALKSGAHLGRPTSDSAEVRDIGGSNPWAGISTGRNDATTATVVELLGGLRHRGRPVVRETRLRDNVMPPQAANVYPDVLVQFEPQYAPTWNLFGPTVAPIITRRRLSGGHTRRAVYASAGPLAGARPTGSVEVYAALREIVTAVSGR
jgi:hypothetical protein